MVPEPPVKKQKSDVISCSSVKWAGSEFSFTLLNLTAYELSFSESMKFKSCFLNAIIRIFKIFLYIHMQV